MKACKRCGQKKALSDFSDGRAVCKPCRDARRREVCSKDVNKFLTRLFHQVRSRANRRNLAFNIDAEFVQALWREQGGLCAISRLPMTHHWDGRGSVNDYNVSIDQKLPSGGYTQGNVQLVCARVNAMKNEMDESTLYWWSKVLSTNMSPNSEG